MKNSCNFYLINGFKKSTKPLFALICVFLLSTCGVFMTEKKSEVLTMALPGTWGPLIPPLQSSANAEMVLVNVFEALVQYDLDGNLLPGTALSWEIASNFSEFTFHIDTSKKFSNGELLTSYHIKKSFEDSLKVVPSSFNKSALDLLYKLRNFDSYKDTGTLEGVVTPSKDVLIIKFEKPFRQALFYLSGIRYASYIIDQNGNYLGTGPYQISSSNESYVKLSENKYSNQKLYFKNAEIFAVESGNWDSECESRYYDVYWLSKKEAPKCLNNISDFISESGAIRTHIAIDVNGLENRIFHKLNLRRAFLKIFYSKVIPNITSYDKNRTTFDIQFYHHLQPGRLSQAEVEKIINEGEPWIQELQNISKKNPIVVFGAYEDVLNEITSLLKKNGLNVDARLLTSEQMLESYYKKFDFDLMIAGAGTGGLDPDDLYHYLGKNGSITSPVVGRPMVWEYFEEGRTLTDPEEIQHVYQKVNRAILEEVPSVHIGFLRTGFIYNKDRIHLERRLLNCEKFGLSVFQLK